MTKGGVLFYKKCVAFFVQYLKLGILCIPRLQC